jgi:hypothetical protein
MTPPVQPVPITTNPFDSIATPKSNPFDELAQTNPFDSMQPSEVSSGKAALNTLSNIASFLPTGVAGQSSGLETAISGLTSEHLGQVMDILKERASNALDMASVGVRLASSTTTPEDIQNIQNIGKDAVGIGQKVSQAVSNYVHAPLHTELLQAITGPTRLAWKLASGIPASLVNMAGSLLEAGTGTDIHSKAFTVAPATAEQHADAIQSTLSNIAMIAVTDGVGKAIGEPAFAPSTIDLGGGVTAREVAALGTKAAGSTKGLGTALVAGAAGGLAGGAIQDAGKPDGHILSSMIDGVLMAAPLAVGFKLWHNISNASERASGIINAQKTSTEGALSTIPRNTPKTAQALEAIRQISVVETPTIEQAIGVGSELGKTPDDLHMAILRSRINLPNNSILSGASDNVAGFAKNVSEISDRARYEAGGLAPDDAILAALARDYVSSGGTYAGMSELEARQLILENEKQYGNANTRSFAFFKRADGLHDILIGNSETPLSLQQRLAFSKYGFTPGEIVSVDGADYKMTRPLTNDNFIVTDDAGEQHTVNRNAISRTQNNVLTPNTFDDAIWNQFLEDNFRERPSTAGKKVEPIAVSAYKLPAGQKYSTPRFGKYIPQWDSDFDKAAYMVGKKSGSPNPTLVQHVTNTTGLPLEAIKQHGSVVRDAVKTAAAEKGTGGGIIRIPKQEFSYSGPRAPITFAEALPQIEAATKSLAELVTGFAQSIGIADDQIPAMMRDFNERFIDGAQESGVLNPREVKVFNAVAEAAKQAVQVRAQGKINHIGDLDANLRRNNMYLEANPGGIYVIRDMETGIPIFTGRSAEELNSVIRQSRQTKSVALDGGTNGSTTVAPPTLLKPEQTPFHYTQNPTKFGAFTDWLDRVPYITKAADYFRSSDNKLKTNLLNEVYNRVRGAGEAARRDQLRIDTRLNLFRQKYSDLTPQQYQLGGNLVETASPDELIQNGYYQGSQYHPDEIELGKQMSQPSVDITKTGRYILGVKAIQQQLAGAPQAMANAIAKWGDRFAKNPLNNDEQVVAQRILDASKNPDIHTPAIFRLAYSYAGDGLHPEYSKSEFIRNMAVPPRVVDFAKELEQFHSDLADEFGVETRINNYFSHKRLLGDSDYFRFDAKGNIVPSDIPFFQLTRTGLMNEYQLNPFESIHSYARAGFRAKYIAPALEDAEKYLDSIQEQAGPDFAAIKNRALALYGDVQGFPTKDIVSLNSAVGKAFKKVGLTGDIRQVINLLTSNINVNRLGPVSSAAIRDLTNAITQHWAFLGENNPLKTGLPTSSPTSRMIGLLFNDENVQAAKDKGVNIDLPMLQLENAGVPGSPSEEFGRSLVGKMERANQVIYNMSGQPLFFARTVAATYLERVEALSNLVRDWQNKNINSQQFIEQSRLRRYDQATIDQFNQLIAKQQNEAAIDFLAKETIKHLNMDFGSGANPQGWTTSIGRIIGMNGQWTIGQRSFLARGLSNGTWGDKLGFAYRNLASNGAVFGAGGAMLGVNMGSWLTIPTSVGSAIGVPRSPIWKAVTDGQGKENLLPFGIANWDRAIQGFLNFAGGNFSGAIQKFSNLPAVSP